MRRPNQSTFSTSPTSLDELVAPEPFDARGVRCVLVSSTSSRTLFHKQDIYQEGEPACGQILTSEHSTWIEKPKGAMQRAGLSPCPDCYSGEVDA